MAGDRHLGPVTDIVVRGERIYSVSQGGVYEGMGDNLRRIHQPDFRVTALAVAPGHLVLVGGQPGRSGKIATLDLQKGDFRSLRVADDLVYDVAAHGSTAALACADGRVLTIPVPDLDPSSIRERHRHTAAARAVAISPDGRHLVSGGLDSLLLLSALKGGASPVQIQDHTAKVDCLVFSPDGRQIASGARDGKVRIHNLDGRLLRTYLGLASESAEIVWDNNPYIFSLAWGGRPVKLMAGAAKGGIYDLSLANNTWKRVSTGWAQPIYSLFHDAEGKLLTGTHGELRR